MASFPQRQMQDEMERFEAEISNSTSKPSIPSVLKPNMIRPTSGAPGVFQQKFQPPTHFLPTQLQRAGVRPTVSSISQPFSSSTSAPPSSIASSVGTAIISNKPVLYLPDKEAKASSSTSATANLIKTPQPVAKKAKVEAKSPTKVVPTAASGPSVLRAPSSTVGSATVKAGTEEPKVQKMKKPKKFVRAAGGTVWQDDSLLEWDPNDYRIFCGDLGNDVTDEVLARVFGKFPSFQKAKVIRDARSNKTKGFGFVSFKDPTDFTRAMREMNGKYVGSRPIKLRKSNWKNRNIDEVKKRQKEKDVLLGKRR
ncbi:RNA-binding protein 42-like [Daphnia pulicaria]|uniref:RNA-binding protein 42-like n=1 Tax=Daphnia pulicaria TaxID=35523 RepID=UPI001EEC2560|nr:RNA-binding protein 42-like [Daphnia pulicaria]